MSPIDKIMQEALALPTELKVQLVEQLVASLNSNTEEQVSVNQKQENSLKSQDFWHKLEKLKLQMQEEKIEVDPQEVWSDIRAKEIGREITLP